MTTAKHRSPLVSIIEPDGTEVRVHPIDAIEITRNGLGKYKDIAQAPHKVQEELQRIEKQVASAVTPTTEATASAVTGPEAPAPAEDSVVQEEEDPEGDKASPAPKLKRRGQTTAGNKEG